MFETLVAATGLTFIMMVVSVLYYLKGKKQGMEFVLQLLYDNDKKAFNRLHTTLQKELSNV
jgi:predicted PurR-regulated permease PerM